MRLSTHILDTALGRPAAGVPVSLARLDGELWNHLHEHITDHDGRVTSMLPEFFDLGPGLSTLRLRFAVAAYFAAKNQLSLYPYIDIIFKVESGVRYHIPLLLTANGYTTYRGS